MDIFSDRIRGLRKSKKWTQEEAAKQFNVPLRTYCRYEAGERETPFPIAVKIATVYDISLDYLAGRTDRQEFTATYDERKPSPHRGEGAPKGGG